MTRALTDLFPWISNRSDVSDLARLGGERQRRGLSVRAIVLRGLDLRVRVAVVLQLVERQLASGHDKLAVARLSNLERHLVLQRVQMVGRNHVEPDEGDGGNPDGFAFGDRDGDVDRVLFVVQLDVETGHARIGIPAVGVERLDPLQVRVEASPVEVRLSAPGQLGALARGERVAQARRVDRLHADET